jgi:hypothetical protein
VLYSGFRSLHKGNGLMKTKRVAGILAFFGMWCCLAMPIFGASIAFSTGETNRYSWILNIAGGIATMSFTNNDVDISNPNPDSVLNDHINIPDMTLTNITSVHVAPGIDLVTAVLTPNSPALLTITADTASGPATPGDIVMSAATKMGGMLTVGTNFVAYSDQTDDLDVLQYVKGYSTVIDQFAALDNQGLNMDLSFSGDTSGSLYNILRDLKDGSVTGALSGQIVIVPEPLTLGLIGLGGLMLLRRKY